jgi:hypothetical protein
MLIIVEQAEEAHALLGKGPGPGEGMDRAVDDNYRGPSGQGHFLTRVDHDLRQGLVRRMILYKEALARGSRGDDGL